MLIRHAFLTFILRNRVIILARPDAAFVSENPESTLKLEFYIMHYGNEKHFLQETGGVLIPFREVRGLPDFYT